MLLSEIYQKLHSFTLYATALDNSKVIFANQKGARQIKPFITISIGNFKNIGHKLSTYFNSGGIRTTEVNMVCTASFQAFCDIPFQAEDLLNKVYIKFFSTSLSADGALTKWRTIKNVSAVPVVLNEQTESRAVLEVELAYTQDTKDDIGLIETIYITNKFDNKESVINIDD